jgi:hypothetical protein
MMEVLCSSETSVHASSPILVILMIEALHSSKTSVLTRATQRNILEDGILHVVIYQRVESVV